MMPSNSRITRSQGPSDGTSLPPYTRPKKDTNEKADKAESMMTPTQQQTTSDQLNNTVGHSPFARPSSRAGTSTTPVSATQPPHSPFARPGSRAGSSTELTDNMQNSPTSSGRSDLFPRDNTSASSDLTEVDLDAEVAGLAGQHKQQQTPVPSMSGVETSNQLPFQPILPAYVTPTRHRDQALYNSSLNLIDDSPRPQTSGSTAYKPQQPAPHIKMPPTPYVNQTTVNQHMNKHPAQPCGAPAGMGNPPQQQIPSVGTPLCPPNAQPIPLVGTPLCPPNAQPAPFPTFQNSPVDTRTKSKNGQGVKRSKKSPADKPDTNCWRCKQPGHFKRDCPMPPFCVKCRQEGHLPYNCPQQNNRNTSANTSAQATVDHQFSNIRNNCIHCGGLHEPAVCPTKAGLHTASTAPKGTQQPGIVGTGKNNSNVFPLQFTVNGSSTAGDTPPTRVVNNLPMQHGHPTANQIPRATPQVSPHMSQNQYTAQPIQNQFAPPAYFPITFPPPPIAPSNVSAVPSAPASDLSAAITLMTNAVNQGHSNTTAITDALQTTASQFADALQKTIQMGVDAQAEETQNARLDKQFDKIKIFDGSNPAECHSWLEEVHALCLQTGRPFREMLLLCAGQAV